MKYAFVDWAGDAGFKFRLGSSRYLVIAAIFCDDYDQLKNDLASLRQRWGLKQGFVFHYIKASRKIKPAFFKTLADTTFTAKVLVVDKPQLPHPFWKMPGQRVVNHFIAELVVGAPKEVVEGANLIFDEQRDATKIIRGLRVAISAQLRIRKFDYYLKKVTARPAKDEDGIQVADMIAGAAFEEVMGKRASHLQSLSGKIELIYHPPK